MAVELDATRFLVDVTLTTPLLDVLVALVTLEWLETSEISPSSSSSYLAAGGWPLLDAPQPILLQGITSSERGGLLRAKKNATSTSAQKMKTSEPDNDSAYER
jgi:hypothetical protein